MHFPALKTQLENVPMEPKRNSVGKRAWFHGLEVTWWQAAHRGWLALKSPTKVPSTKVFSQRACPQAKLRKIPSDPHDLKSIQARTWSRKVSDEFTVSLCRVHHQNLHQNGNENTWWANLQIASLPIAKQLSRAAGRLRMRRATSAPPLQYALGLRENSSRWTCFAPAEFGSLARRYCYSLRSYGWSNILWNVYLIQGDEMKRPAVFFDRDGVLNEDSGYVFEISKLRWIDGAREAVKIANDARYFVFVVTNQSGVARGLYEETHVEALHKWMADDLASIGAHIDAFEYCPYHPDAAIERYRQISLRRKPAPGMINDLLARFSVDVGRSILIGDKSTDLEAARAAGIHGCLYSSGNLAQFLRPLLHLHGSKSR
jgi:D-glycero-D-manno-heptose 1,7-bisphosphate phosphatase